MFLHWTNEERTECLEFSEVVRLEESRALFEDETEFMKHAFEVLKYFPW